MGCLLGCFGFKKKRKRLKPRNKYLSIEQNHGSYVPLDSEVKTKFTGKQKNPTKIKKKVSFNLNVKEYEPIPFDDYYQNYFSDGEEDNKTSLHYEERLIESNIRNHRYQNCIEDEDDQFFYDENDLSFDYDVDEDEENFHSSEGDENEISSQDMDEDGDINSRAEGKSGNFYSVLNPVENLAQWKQVKARKALITQSQKVNEDLINMEHRVSSKSFVLKNVEDSSPCLVQDRGISVDTSLSNWLK